MIDAIPIWENAVEALQVFRAALAHRRIINDETNGASAIGLYSAGDFFLRVEERGELTMNFPSTSSALCLFILKPVHLGENVGRNADVIFLKAVQASGVMQEDIGIEHVVFPNCFRGFETELLELLVSESVFRGRSRWGWVFLGFS